MEKLTFLLAFTLLSLTLQAQNVTHSWDFNTAVSGNVVDNWTIQYYSNAATDNGILNLTATTGAGYCSLTYNVPAGVTIDPSVSKIFKIRVKNGTKDRRTNFIWTNEFGDSKMEVIMSVEDAGFKEYTIDLTHDHRWKGTITKLLLQMPIPVTTASVGSLVSVDFLRFTEALPSSLLPVMVPKTPAPFGVNLSGGEFSYGTTSSNWRYPRQQELDYLQAKGFKLIRLPFLWERIQPVLNGPLDEESLSQLKNLVWAARTRGIWVVLDLHNYNRRRVLTGSLVNPPATPNITDYVIGTPTVPIATIEDVWAKLAGEFKDFDNVYAYGIMNEPYGVPREIPWVNTAQKIINAVRTRDTVHTIMVGGDSYSSAQQWPNVSNNLRSLADPSNDLMFEAHIYFDQNSSGEYTTYEAANANPQTGVTRVTPFVEWLKKYKLRGFMGEYGIPNDDPRWNAVLENTLIYLKENGVNGTYWSYGTSWGTYKLHVYPDGGADRPQMAILQNYLFADAPSALPGINSSLAVNYRITDTVVYKPSATNSPVSFTVTDLPAGLSYNTGTKEITGTIPAGTHTIKISAANAAGTGAVTDAILRGMDLKIPGTVESENYNPGGQNIGYYDTSIGNSGNSSYRDDGVDIRLAGSIYAVTHTIAGEWLKYTVNADNAGSYSVKMRYATTAAGGKINLKADGTLVAENMELPATGSLTTWREISFEIPAITQGLHEFTLEIVSGGFDFDRLQFSLNFPPAAAPANATASAFGSKKVNLSWGAVTGATSYKIERSETENGIYAAIAENLTATTFADTAALPLTTYFYVVKGVNLAGDGPASSKVSATTTAFTVPAQVSGLSLSGADGSVELNWTPLPDVDHYNVKRSVVQGGPYTTAGTPAGNIFTDTTVTNNTTYYYVVSALNAAGEGLNSQEESVEPSNVDYAYWKFDEGNSTTGVADLWGEFSGTFPTGAVVNAGSGDISFITGTNAKLNNAIRFRGTTNAFVKIPDGIMSDLDNFTISVWYRHIAGDLGRIFDFGVGDGYTTSTPDANKKHIYLIAKGSNSAKTIIYGAQNGGAPQLVETNVSVTTGQFYHIVITQSGSTVTVYVNGVQAGQRTDITVKPSDLGLTDHNYLGRSRYAHKLDGVLDEFRIFGRALTQSEVLALNSDTLPVSFLAFTGKKEQRSVVLNWSTASENNNSHFEVLHSSDGKSFFSIANIPVKNDLSVKKYQYTDNLPLPGINYYQLKQVDPSGEYTARSKSVMVSDVTDSRDRLKIYTSDNKISLRADALKASGFKMYIRDMTGRIRAEFAGNIVPGSNSFDFELHGLNDGIYAVTFQSSFEQTVTKIILQGDR